MSLEAGTYTLTKPQNAATCFLSTPGNLHSSNSDKTRHRSRKLSLSPSQISALSVGDISGLGFVSEQMLSYSDEDKSSEQNNKQTPTRWRLIYNPWCVVLGLASIAHTAGCFISIQCVPPLGKQIGKCVARKNQLKIFVKGQYFFCKVKAK